MAAFDWPDVPAARPAGVEWAQVLPEAVSSSVFNQYTQSTVLGPAYWSVTVTIGSRTRQEVRQWEAWIAAILVASSKVRFWNWPFEVPSGSAGGAPLVNGAGQVGTAIVTDGWPIATAGVLLPGDFVGVGGELRRVMGGVNSDGAGQATLILDQPVRTSPADNSAIVTSKPKALFICTTDKRSRGFKLDSGRWTGPTLQFMEVFSE